MHLFRVPCKPFFTSHVLWSLGKATDNTPDNNEIPQSAEQMNNSNADSITGITEIKLEQS